MGDIRLVGTTNMRTFPALPLFESFFFLRKPDIGPGPLSTGNANFDLELIACRIRYI